MFIGIRMDYDKKMSNKFKENQLDINRYPKYFTNLAKIIYNYAIS